MWEIQNNTNKCMLNVKPQPGDGYLHPLPSAKLLIKHAFSHWFSLCANLCAKCSKLFPLWAYCCLASYWNHKLILIWIFLSTSQQQSALLQTQEHHSHFNTFLCVFNRIWLCGLWQSSSSTESCYCPEVQWGPGSDGQSKKSVHYW